MSGTITFYLKTLIMVLASFLVFNLLFRVFNGEGLRFFHIPLALLTIVINDYVMANNEGL